MMYVIQTDLAPGLIGVWACPHQAAQYAAKLTARGWRATVVQCDTPRVEHKRINPALATRRAFIKRRR